MKNNSKCNKVKKICDGITSTIDLKDYIVFDDNWISENDKTLYDENGNSFSVLDFKEIEENTLVNPEVMPYFDAWKFCKFSCVKLDKVVNVGDIFYNNKN